MDPHKLLEMLDNIQMRLSDIETAKTRLAVLPQSRPGQLLRATLISFRRTNCSQMAAGIALFAMLSLLPLIMLMVSILSPAVQALSPDYDMRRGILHFAQVTVSPVARAWLQGVLQSLARNGIVVDALTFLTFMWASLNVFSQLDASFHRIWHDGEAGTASNLRQVMLEQIRRRRNAFFLLLLILVGFVSTSLLGRWTSEWLPAVTGRLTLVQAAVTSFVAWLEGAVFLALLYRWLLPEKTRWRGILLGAVLASAANLLVRVLVTYFVDTTIGATNPNVGGPLALMLGVYLASQNILIGCIVVRQHVRIYP